MSSSSDSESSNSSDSESDISAAFGESSSDSEPDANPVASHLNQRRNRPEMNARRRIVYALRKKPKSKVLNLRELGEDWNSRLRSSAIRALLPLLTSDIGSDRGIPITLDAPYGNKPMINILRPAVIRIYFGKRTVDQSGCEPWEVRRCSYGTGSGTGTVGIDPRSFQTKEMSEEMQILASEVLKVVNADKELSRGMSMKDGFNHLTVLLYLGGDIRKIVTGCSRAGPSALGLHTDQTFTNQSVFQTGRNSQVELTPTVVLTMGDLRSLNMRKRQVKTNPKTGRGNWKQANEECTSFQLAEGSLFVLHPSDEKPAKRGPDPSSFSQFQHEVSFTGSGLSIAMVFRCVGSSERYHAVSNHKVVSAEDLVALNRVGFDKASKKAATRGELFDSAKNIFDETQKNVVTKQLKEWIKGKLCAWNWSG